ncbi:Dienelactone hydrolase family protein [Minicystis rosea]|nr:Dienelactone hydrolase family protein [Minicystis rosea]
MREIITESIDIPVADGTAMGAYVARPAGAGPHPGLLLFQEIFGINEHVRDVARRFAAEGYVVLAPELFHRFAPGYQGSYDDIPASIAMAGKLVPEGLVADIKASAAALAGHAAVAKGRIGAIGYCMGGGMAFAANALTELEAAVSYYGTPQAEMQEQLAASLHAPMLFVWAGKDVYISLERRREVSDLMRKHGKPFVEAEWTSANHGFFCDAREDYHAASAKQAWALTLAFLAEHLGA